MPVPILAGLVGDRSGTTTVGIHPKTLETADKQRINSIVIPQQSDLTSPRFSFHPVAHAAKKVDMACACDAAFISSTFCDPEVVRHAKDMGMVSIPGVSTPAQAVLALEAGGDILKVFPSTNVSPKDFREIVDSVSPTIPVVISGGVNPEQLEAYSVSGASGFAVGRTLFEPEMKLANLSAKARCFLDAASRIRWPTHDGPFRSL